jgi:hypothetical protein
MFTTLSLPVPISWQIPDLLSSSSPEENKLIIESGCQILMSSRAESAGLNNKDAQLRLKRDAESKIDEARSKFNHELDDLRSKLSEEKMNFQRVLAERDAQIDVLTAFKGSAQSHINEIRQDTRNSLMEEMISLKEEIAKIKRSSDEERLRWLDGSKEEREIARLEREKILSSSEKERESLLQQIRELNKASTAIQVRKANSSTKGGDNERDFLEIIKNTFGIASDFTLLKKELNAGDHRFDWEGYRIMTENKIGYTESALRQKEGLPKAIKDFTNNSDCDILLFISEDTVVPDHSKPGDIDFGIIDRRPAIFIGNFAKHEDKVYYINSILMPTMRILLRVYKSNDTSKIDDSERLGDVIHKVQCLKNNYIGKFIEFQKSIKAFERVQASGVDGIKCAANSLLELFNSSLNTILNEEEKLIEDSEPCLVYTNEALQGMKMEPELQEIARKLNISGRTKLTKGDLIKKIIEKNIEL